jgi:hypothetical protein
MKVFLAVVAGLLLAASALCFALGSSWDKAGRLNHEVGGKDRAVYDLGDAFSAVGDTLQCAGVIGLLLAVALLAARFSLAGYERRICRLEEEVEALRGMLSALRTSRPRPEAGNAGGGAFFARDSGPPARQKLAGGTGDVQDFPGGTDSPAL